MEAWPDGSNESGAGNPDRGGWSCGPIRMLRSPVFWVAGFVFCFLVWAWFDSTSRVVAWHPQGTSGLYISHGAGAIHVSRSVGGWHVPLTRFYSVPKSARNSRLAVCPAPDISFGEDWQSGFRDRVVIPYWLLIAGYPVVLSLGVSIIRRTRVRHTTRRCGARDLSGGPAVAGSRSAG